MTMLQKYGATLYISMILGVAYVVGLTIMDRPAARVQTSATTAATYLAEAALANHLRQFVVPDAAAAVATDSNILNPANYTTGNTSGFMTESYFLLIQTNTNKKALIHVDPARNNIERKIF